MSDHDDWTLIDRGDECGLYRHRDGTYAVLNVAALRQGRVHDARHPPVQLSRASDSNRQPAV